MSANNRSKFFKLATSMHGKADCALNCTYYIVAMEIVWK